MTTAPHAEDGRAPRPELEHVAAVIFDRDGVLTDFDVDWLGAYFQPIVDCPLMLLSKAWLDWCHDEAPPTNAAEEAQYWSRFWDRFADGRNLGAGARAALHAFDYTDGLIAHEDGHRALHAAKSRGLATGVLSNFPLASLERSLERVGLGGLVDVACSAPVLGASKPDRRAYEAIAKRLGVAPEECLFIDDEWPCVMGAHDAGMMAVHLERGRAVTPISEGELAVGQRRGRSGRSGAPTRIASLDHLSFVERR